MNESSQERLGCRHLQGPRVHGISCGLQQALLEVRNQMDGFLGSLSFYAISVYVYTIYHAAGLYLVRRCDFILWRNLWASLTSAALRRIRQLSLWSLLRCKYREAQPLKSGCGGCVEWGCVWIWLRRMNSFKKWMIPCCKITMFVGPTKHLKHIFTKEGQNVHHGRSQPACGRMDGHSEMVCSLGPTLCRTGEERQASAVGFLPEDTLPHCEDGQVGLKVRHGQKESYWEPLAWIWGWFQLGLEQDDRWEVLRSGLYLFPGWQPGS